jgi:hypothetical protein
MWSYMLTVCKDECFDDTNAWYTPCDVIQYANSMQGCMCFDDTNAWYTPCDVIQYANSMQGCMCFDDTNAWYTPCDVIQYANSMQGCMCFDDMNAWCLSCNDGWSCYDVMQHMRGACYTCSVYMQNDYAKHNARWHMRHDNDLMCEHDDVKFNEHADVCGC